MWLQVMPSLASRRISPCSHPEVTAYVPAAGVAGPGRLVPVLTYRSVGQLRQQIIYPSNQHMSALAPVFCDGVVAPYPGEFAQAQAAHSRSVR